MRGQGGIEPSIDPVGVRSGGQGGNESRIEVMAKMQNKKVWSGEGQDECERRIEVIVQNA